METKHKGPWHHGNGYIIRDANNDPVANCHYTEPQSLILQEHQLANAEFIVRACNAYDDMLEALKAIEPMTWNDSPLLKIYAKEIEQLRAAITKAEDKKE